MKKTNEHGRSMIEMLGVLAIIGVLSVGGIAGFSKAMERYRVNKTIQQVTYIAGNIRTLYRSQKNYNDLPHIHSNNTNADIINFYKKTHVVPEEMIDGNSLKDPFGGGVSIEAWSGSVTISYEIGNQEACIALATQDWSGFGFNSFAIENNYAESLYWVACNPELDEGCADSVDGNGVVFMPMPVEVATRACVGKMAYLYWNFY